MTVIKLLHSFTSQFSRPARHLLFFVGSVILGGLSEPVGAQQFQDAIACTERLAIATKLKSIYAEKPIGLGVTAAGTLMELWQSRGGDTWTLLLTLPDGNSCIVGSGNGWMMNKLKNFKGL